MIGKINKIIPMSVVDGPGNRTAIFLQGCNFNCTYCHNPETIKECIHCGICVKHCEVSALKIIDSKVVWDKAKCINCDKCIEVCPHDSSPKILFMSGKELANLISKNIPFITGITTSGGECTLQHEFLTELYTEVKKFGLSALTDTNGSVDLSLPMYKDMVEASDGFMVDVKAWNKIKHFELTNSDNEIVKKNLKFLAKQNKLTEIRTVCMDGFDNESIITSCGTFLKEELKHSPIVYKIIAYRHFGVRQEFKFLKSPNQEKLQKLKQIALDLGFKAIVI